MNQSFVAALIHTLPSTQPNLNHNLTRPLTADPKISCFPNEGTAFVSGYTSHPQLTGLECEMCP